MEFIIENFPDKKFNLILLTNIKNFDYLKEIDNRSDIVILNPEYVF